MQARSAPLGIRRFSSRSSASAALDRRSLDVYARARQDQLQGDKSSAPISRSSAAKRGKVPHADVALPEELEKTVTRIIDGMDNKRAIHDRAFELYRRLRHTSGPQTSQPSAERLHFDVSTSVAYLAGIMPAVYTATLSVFEILRQRLELLATTGKGGGPEEVWQPDRLVDYGSGTGSAAWAFERVWGVESKNGAQKEYIGFESSRPMLELSSGLFGAIPLRHTDDGAEAGQLSSNRLDARAHHIQVPVAPTTLAKMQLAPTSYADKRTIALAAFSLGDLGRSSRKELVQAMWDSGSEYIVLIDRGTPRGSRMVIEARDQLLAYGRREVHRARGVEVEDQVDLDLHAVGLEIMPEGAEEGSNSSPVDPSLGSHVIAPCPHDARCPMSGSTRGFCHFSRRLQIPDFLQKTKGTKRGEDDAKYSYVIIRRGQRPVPREPERPSAFADMLASLDAGRPATAADTTSSPGSTMTVSATQSEAPVDPAADLAWARIIAPPSKGSGHVTLDTCASSGEIERHVVSKRLGRQPYYDARKSAWGDSFPHKAHNGPIPSPLTAESTSASHADRDRKPQNKFGGDFKERTTKAERQQGREAARELRMGARRDRSMRREHARAAREEQSRSAARLGGSADEHGVIEYELDAQGNII